MQHHGAGTPGPSVLRRSSRCETLMISDRLSKVHLHTNARPSALDANPPLLSSATCLQCARGVSDIESVATRVRSSLHRSYPCNSFTIQCQIYPGRRAWHRSSTPSNVSRVALFAPKTTGDAMTLLSHDRYQLLTRCVRLQWRTISDCVTLQAAEVHRE